MVTVEVDAVVGATRQADHIVGVETAVVVEAAVVVPAVETEVAAVAIVETEAVVRIFTDGRVRSIVATGQHLINPDAFHAHEIRNKC